MEPPHAAGAALKRRKTKKKGSSLVGAVMAEASLIPSPLGLPVALQCGPSPQLHLTQGTLSLGEGRLPRDSAGHDDRVRGSFHRFSGLKGPGTKTYPVHNEDLAGLALLLQLPAGDGHRVEEAEAPEKRRERSCQTDPSCLPLSMPPARPTSAHPGLVRPYMAVEWSAWCPGGRTTAKPFWKQKEHLSSKQPAL